MEQQTDQEINDQPTNQAILDSINTYATRIEGDIAKLAVTMATKADLEKMVTKDYLDQEFTKRFGAFETKMVTKDYLDQKLANLEGNIIGVIRKEDDKVNAVIAPLQKRGVLTADDVTAIHTLDPFPRAS